MDADEHQGEAAHAFGAVAVVIGLLIAGMGFLTDKVPMRGYFFAALLVFVGSAVRIETAIRYRRSPASAGEDS